jgi:hypothetical protein
MSNPNLNENLKNATVQADQVTENARTITNVAWGWLTGHPVVLTVSAFILGFIVG